MQGLLLVDKPTGWTSFDVVNYVRKIVADYENVRPKSIKVGHIGTLDPIATGLLALLIGKEYTVKASSLSKLDKQYEAKLKLGYKSASMDTETELEYVSDRIPSSKEITEILRDFKGKLKQKPPAYSALKINGKRAYQLAREGREVDIKPREVEIYSIKLNEYKYPNIKLSVHVSSGTYIRSLVDDIGKVLKTGALMTALSRTKIGNYELSGSLKTENLTAQIIKDNLLSL